MLGGGVSGACRVVCCGILGREGESGKWEGRKDATNAIVNRKAHPDAFAARSREYRTNCIPFHINHCGWTESGQPPERSPKCHHILTNATYRRKVVRHAES